jgi:DNA-binding transcriptional LysR family regulator
MILKNLQYLAALAQEKHFARAAASCHVTQPTLSAGIKQLEEELGLLIVRRGQRFAGFTAEGERILVLARRVLADYDSLQQGASEMRAGLVGRLRVGVVPTALPMVSLLTSPFAATHPRVSITILSHSSIEIQRGLDDFILDAGLTYLDNEPLTHVRTVPLYQERYYLFTPAATPLSTRRVTWAEAAQLPLCLLTPDMQNRRIVNAHFAAAGVDLKATIETNSVLALWDHLQGGTWSSVLPQTFLYLFGQSDRLKVIPLEGVEAGHTIGLAVPDREPLTPSARELVKIATEVDVASALEKGRRP